MNKKKLLNQIQSLITLGEKFTRINFCYPHKNPKVYGGEDRPEWLTWKTRCYNLIKEIVAPNSPAAALANTAVSIPTHRYYLKSFDRQKETMIQALKLATENIKRDSFDELKKSTPKKGPSTSSNKIFIVHGHDTPLKTELENFLSDIGIEPIILHKKPDEGQTIIEKFEKHSDVGYAFILLTPDEIAYTIDQEKLDDSIRNKEKRARPNVIFEFGFFVGMLGRNRVCCLYKGDVELPSDLGGLLYKKIETTVDAQGLNIIKELRAAEYQIKIK